MDFSLEHSLQLLERTPAVLRTWLAGLSHGWTHHNEGGDTWSVFDVVGHLIHGDRNDMMGRVLLILSDAPERKFAPFDRFAQLAANKEKSLDDLLDEFADVRRANMARLRSLQLDEAHFEKTGEHPVFGTVTLRQLLSTWTAHDLDHLSQIARVMAKQYQAAVGPWAAYLRVMQPL